MRQHLERFRSGVPAISFVIVLAVVGTACVVDTDRDVAQTGDALYRGTLYSIAPGERRAFRLPSGASVEYEVVTGGEFRPVPVDSCDVPFCQSWEDTGNVEAWMNQWAFMFMKLRIRNGSSSSIRSRYKVRVDCVYASGNPLPAPWQTFNQEEHDDEVGTRAGETREVDIGCMDVGPGSTFESAWPTGGSVDVSVHDDAVTDPLDAPTDPLDSPWA